MGHHPEVTDTKYPKQGLDKGRRAKVRFHSNLSVEFKGTIIRDDMSEPYRTIIQLDDGRVVLGTECAYEIITEVAQEAPDKYGTPVLISRDRK